jgi:hypothetical protein
MLDFSLFCSHGDSALAFFLVNVVCVCRGLRWPYCSLILGRNLAKLKTAAGAYASGMYKTYFKSSKI